jgi:hypothetical protein
MHVSILCDVQVIYRVFSWVGCHTRVVRLVGVESVTTMRQMGTTAHQGWGGPPPVKDGEWCHCGPSPSAPVSSRTSHSFPMSSSLPQGPTTATPSQFRPCSPLLSSQFRPCSPLLGRFLPLFSPAGRRPPRAQGVGLPTAARAAAMFWWSCDGLGRRQQIQPFLPLLRVHTSEVVPRSSSLTTPRWRMCARAVSWNLGEGSGAWIFKRCFTSYCCRRFFPKSPYLLVHSGLHSPTWNRKVLLRLLPLWTSSSAARSSFGYYLHGHRHRPHGAPAWLLTIDIGQSFSEESKERSAAMMAGTEAAEEGTIGNEAPPTLADEGDSG